MFEFHPFGLVPVFIELKRESGKGKDGRVR